MSKLKNITKYYLTHRFLFNLFFLSALFLGHCFWGNMMYIVFPIVAILIILDNLENGFSYIIFSLPFCFLNLNISALLLLICGFIYIVKFYLVKYLKDKTKPNYFILGALAIFLIYCLLPIGEYNLRKLIRILLLLSILIALYTIAQKPEIFRGHFNIKLICYAIILSSVFSLTYYFSPYLKGYLEIAGVNDNLPRFMALFFHTNVLAIFCEFILSLLMYFIISKKATISDYILFCIIGAIGILTFSKTYFVILIFILLFFLIWRLCCDFKKTALIALPILVVIIGLCLIFPKFINIFINRFIGDINNCKNFSDFMNMITTTRYSLWVEYLKYIIHNPLVLFFGRGLGAPILPTTIYSPHNAYIAIIYEFGLVGTVLFATTIFFILRADIKKHKIKLHWAVIVPILVMCMIFMVEDFFFYVF